ncbi:HupE/UreJ family protein [Rhizobacter fulvus]|jgi:urease accessory protein
MKTSTLRRLGAAATLAALAGSAAAHTGHGTHGLLAGLEHPLALDHLLAMGAVGVWSMLALRGSQRALGPLTFLAAMVAGAALGVMGLQLPFVEQGIAASVLLCGLMLVFAQRLAPALGLALVAAAALLHGLAHGAEAPAGAGFAAYAIGFVVTTAALHAGGLALGARLQRMHRLVWPLGTLLGAAGLALLVRA